MSARTRRISIEDLSEGTCQQLTEQQMRSISGGATFVATSPTYYAPRITRATTIEPRLLDPSLGVVKPIPA